MAVAKRQRRKKPAKTEQRKVEDHREDRRVKQTAVPAGPVHTGQAQEAEKAVYQEKPESAGLPFQSFGPARRHASRMHFPLLADKTAVTLVHLSLHIFAAARQDKEITNSSNRVKGQAGELSVKGL